MSAERRAARPDAPRCTFEAVTRRLLREGGLERRHCVLYSMDALREGFHALRSEAPSGWRHSLSVQAVPLPFVLRAAVEAGLGLACASRDECERALSARCPPDRVLYSSPCKTVSDLEWSLVTGIHVNVDSFAELDRVSRILAARPGTPRSVVGLHVNPLGDAAAGHSPWGLHLTPLNVRRLKERLVHCPWLTCLHVDPPPTLLASGVRTAVALAAELNTALGWKQLVAVEIGAAPPGPVGGHVALLREAVPRLFESGLRVLTRFGHARADEAGCAVSLVEYVKPCATEAPDAVLVTHCDLPGGAWAPRLRATVLDATGEPVRKSRTAPFDVVGPSRTILRGACLPPVTAGDVLLLHGVGTAPPAGSPVYSYAAEGEEGHEVRAESPGR